MPLSRRRRRDLAVAVAIAVLMLTAGLVVHLRSDARATTLVTGARSAAPAAMTAAPAALAQVWTLASDTGFPALVSPYGTVVTAAGHAVVGHDATDGSQRWSYARANLALCALGSADTKADALAASGSVRGIITGFSKGDRCSEITQLNPTTGDRMKQRTGFTSADSTLVFGGPYGGFVGDDLVELWRYDLVRTIQYGNQPEPTKPNTKHLDCVFGDLAVTTQQFATIEHCPGTDAGTNAQLVINFADPGATADAKSKSWDALKHAPRATVDLGSVDARVLSLTSENVAVLVATPAPAVVVYDAAGTEQSRTPVPVSAADIATSAAGSRVTPVTVTPAARYLWVGSSLLAIKTEDLSVTWTMGGVLGTPALVGTQLLVPVPGGLAVVDIDTGALSRTIPVDRADHAGSVDVHTVGATVVESRGSLVVGLRDPAAGTATTP